LLLRTGFRISDFEVRKLVQPFHISSVCQIFRYGHVSAVPYCQVEILD
jgi:hypothetical protein